MRVWDLLHPGIVHRKLLHGVPVTFIDWDAEGHGRFFNAAVLCGLGYAHDTCRHSDGREFPIPAGAAHMLEHVLTSAQVDRHVAPIESTGARVTARTGADRMVWGVNFAVAEPDKRHEQVADLVGHLLAIVSEPLEEPTVEQHVHLQAGVVQRERDYRHSNLDYSLQVEMMKALYPGHHLGGDPLGPHGVETSMTAGALAPAMQVLRHDVRAVTIVASVDELLIDTVLRKLEPLCQSISRVRCHATARLPFPESPNSVIVLPSVEHNFGWAAVGVRLPGLRHRQSDRSERAKQLVLGEALAARPGGRRLPIQFTADARTLATFMRIQPPWLEAEDAASVVSVHRQNVCELLRWIADRGVGRAVAYGISSIVETIAGVARLVHRADIHDLTVSEILDAAPHVDRRAITVLEAEVKCAPGTVAYRGPALG